MSRKRILIGGVVAVLVLGAIGVAGSEPTAEPSPAPVAQATPEATIAPIATPASTPAPTVDLEFTTLAIIGSWLESGDCAALGAYRPSLYGVSELVTSALDAAVLACIQSTPEPTEEPDEPIATEEPEPDEPALTASQYNAIEKASDYLDYTAFSRIGLIEQLEFEGFSRADAKFAVDSLDVNWKEQAYQKGLDYLDYSSFSLSGLIDQLEFEGFTGSQAKYGATKAYGD